MNKRYTAVKTNLFVYGFLLQKNKEGTVQIRQTTWDAVIEASYGVCLNL